MAEELSTVLALGGLLISTAALILKRSSENKADLQKLADKEMDTQRRLATLEGRQLERDMGK